jgi:DNA polymerase-3 subunit delta
VISVSSAGRLGKTAWQSLVETPPLDSVVLFLGDDLAKSAPLRIALEQSPHGAAIACYAASRQDIIGQIEARTRAAGLAVTPAARALLTELLGGDAALTDAEIDKLIIYCHGRISIEIEDVEALVTDSSDLNGSEPIDRAFEGKLEDIEAVALRSFREGINPAALLSIALNHAMVLRRLAFARPSGGLEHAIRSERIHFRRADRVRLQSQAWDNAQIARAVDVLSTAQDQARRAPSLDETIAIRALWSIALASRRR